MPDRSYARLKNAQELGSMYDYLAKIILLGPSGCGKSVFSSSFSTRAGVHIAPDLVYYIES